MKEAVHAAKKIRLQGWTVMRGLVQTAWSEKSPQGGGF